MPIMPNIQQVMLRSLQAGVVKLSTRQDLGDTAQTAGNTAKNVVGTVNDAKTAFSSWNNCMQASFCKWPAIALIIVVTLIAFSILFCIARCVCCGLSCCCECCRCLQCCGNCCGCCDPPRSSRKNGKGYLDEPYIPHNQGYTPQAPMVAPVAMPAAKPVPQYAEFDISKKDAADALPEMPSWNKSASSQVVVEDGAVELNELKPCMSATTSQNTAALTGATAGGAAVATMGKFGAPRLGAPTQATPDSYASGPGGFNGPSGYGGPGVYCGPGAPAGFGGPGRPYGPPRYDSPGPYRGPGELHGRSTPGALQQGPLRGPYGPPPPLNGTPQQRFDSGFDTYGAGPMHSRPPGPMGAMEPMRGPPTYHTNGYFDQSPPNGSYPPRGDRNSPAVPPNDYFEQSVRRPPPQAAAGVIRGYPQGANRSPDPAQPYAVNPMPRPQHGSPQRSFSNDPYAREQPPPQAYTDDSAMRPVYHSSQPEDVQQYHVDGQENQKYVPAQSRTPANDGEGFNFDGSARSRPPAAQQPAPSSQQQTQPAYPGRKEYQPTQW